jgi:hypothetical protein
MNRAKRGRLALALLAVLGLTLAACNTPADKTASIGQTETELNLPEEAVQVVALVQTDLAQKLSVAQDEISVMEVKAVEWPDASLGCPAPEQVYDQVITPGYEIVMQADNGSYTYHTGGDNYVQCPDEGPEVLSPDDRDAPATEEADSPLSRLIEQSVRDLAARLGFRVEQIRVEAVEQVDWNDSSLGCPMPGMAYMQVITPGYLIRLSAQDQIYEYHTDLDHVVYCEEAAGEKSMEAKVRADLAQRLGIPEGDVSVVAVKPVDWPDGSLGCPQPGFFYVQVVTPGYQIVLEARGQEYVYHTGLDSFVLCEEPSSTEPVLRERPTEVSRLDPALARLVDQAKQDLSHWLGVPLARIKLKSAKAVQWRDSSLGCPKPGMAYLTVITPGYLILLETDGEVYEYHADSTRAIYCDDPQPPLEDQ